MESGPQCASRQWFLSGVLLDEKYNYGQSLLTRIPFDGAMDEETERLLELVPFRPRGSAVTFAVTPAATVSGAGLFSNQVDL